MKAFKKQRTAITLALVVAIILCAAFSLFYNNEKACAEESTTRFELSAKESVVLVPGDDYKIIFSSDSENQRDGTVATALRQELVSTQRLSVSSDTASDEGKYEILIGRTNRSLSEELYNDCVAAVRDNSLVWGFAYRDGKFAFTAATTEAFQRGEAEFFERFVKDKQFVAEEGLWLIVSLSRADYDAELKAEQDRIEAEKEAARQENIKKLKEEIGRFSFADFTDYVTLDFTVMPKPAFGYPNLYPTESEHPRVNVTPEMLEIIREYIAEESGEGQFFYDALIEKADTEYTGILDAPYMHETGRKGLHNVDEKGLSIIEAKAFAYLLTGDEMYGYQAILAMKNYLKTLELCWIHSDQCREFGRTLFCGAEVYDWCYDLLTEDDKNQFIVAFTDICASKVDEEYSGKCQSGDAQMEVGYPPSLQGSVAGHGAEAQILRDYLSVSIAIFDENPSWYEYVGGRVYNDFIAFRDYYFTSGTYPQGIPTYAPHRHNSDVWSAWLLLCATGENPYSPDLKKITNSFFDYKLPDGSFFGTGDGTRPAKTSSTMINSVIILSALYGDEGMRWVVNDYYGGTLISKKITGNSIEMSLAHHLILGASYYSKTGKVSGVNVNEGKSPVLYHSYPIGQMIAREEWDTSDSAAVFMKVGEKSTANHEHGDGGTFQIFYKGLYTGESGMYDKYGSTHFTYYHQETVAHNGLLVFNPAAAEYKLDGDSVETSKNVAKCFYTGSQQHRSSGFSDLNEWLANTESNTGTVLGHEYMLDGEGKTDYAYLAGDISAAYLPTQATYVGRSMIALYTKNESYPMYFVVYDSITMLDETFESKFLLHTPTEPVVDADNKTVVLTDNEGRLVLHALKGADSINALGGEGQNYLINGIQCALATTGDDGMWGRVEISTTGEKKKEFFNVMYVTDAGNDEKLAPAMIETDILIGTQINSDVIVFAKSEERSTEELVFTSEGTGINRYFVCGLFEGTWNISVDGVTVAHRVSSVDGGMITFYAPAGEVRVQPGKDIAPSNGGRIIYNSFGGIVPESAPLIYEIGQTIPLPQDVTRGADIFLGWYTSPTFEEETFVTEITPTEKGKVVIYAKYKTFPITENYENRDFAFGESNKTFANITYIGNLKTGSWFEVMTDEESGNRYVSISRTVKDMQVDVSKPVASFVSSGDAKITYEIDLARNGDKEVMSSAFMLREDTTSQRVTLFNTLTDGSVVFGGTTLLSLSDRFQKLAITVDFENGMMYAYNVYGDKLAERAFGVPTASSAATTLEWMYLLGYTFNWWMGGGESILADNIRVYCGDYEAPEITFPEGTNRIIYGVGSGTLPDEYPETYTVGEALTLPTPTVKNGNFLGWYTTPTFDEGTEITEINAESADEPFKVYAKYSVIMVSEDYSESEVNNVNQENITINGILYQFASKVGSYAKVESDAKGNTYLKVYTDGKDASINNYTNVAGTTVSGGGKITYEIDLATHADGRVGITTFKPRGNGGSGDSINIFGTNASGQVLLNNRAATPIGMLSTELQRFIFTFDIYAETITAYDIYGFEIASVKVSVPQLTADLYGSVEEWFGATTFAFNWHFSQGGGLCFDNIKIYSGGYKPDKSIIPDNSNVIIYNVGTGKLPDGAPKLYTAGETLTLPTPTTENGKFLGWYTTPTFDEGTEITEINAENADEPIRIYAKFNLTVFENDFTDSTLDLDATGAMSGGIDYVITGKTGTTAKACTDAKGNTYIKVFTDGRDATINLSGANRVAAILNSGGVYTYEISLATHADRRVGVTSFRSRATVPTDSINIFVTDALGQVRLNGSSGEIIAQLGPSFTKLAFTLDLYAETLVAYDEFGFELAAVKISVPAAVADNYSSTAEWFASVTSLFNWQMDAGGGILYDDIKIYTGGYKAEVALPEGTNKIVYNTGSGTLPIDAPKYYSVTEEIILPTPSVKAGSTFIGWYTTPTFEEGTKISVINAENADEPIVLYAKYSVTVIDKDFTGSETVVEAENKSGDGLYYQLNGKTGASVKATTDEQGNTYLKVFTDGTDATVNYNNSALGATIISAGGIVTYEIDLATHADGRVGVSSLKARGAVSSSDVINIFGTNASGDVLLNNQSSLVIGKLGTEFTKFIFTFDLYAETITAYDAAGNVIGSTDVSVPTVSAENYDSVADWFVATTFGFNWHFSANGGILFDNLKIYSGEYVPSV